MNHEEFDDSESIDGSDSGNTDQSKFFSDVRENFTILRREATLEQSHVPDRISTILSPRTLARCDCGLVRDTLNGVGIAGNVFLNDHLLMKDQLPLFQKNPRIWDLPFKV